MYQELIVFVGSFDSHPVWGTEGNDLPLPTLAVGDVLEVPTLHWHGIPEAKPVYRVTAVKHAFTDTGIGPEANHQVLVTIAQDDTPTLDAELDKALEIAERHQKSSAFWQTMLNDLAQQQVPNLLDALVQVAREAMKNQPAHGMTEASSEWTEAASILQADGHLLADTVNKQLVSRVHDAIQRLSREDRLFLWLAHRGMEEVEADALDHDFEPPSGSDAMEKVRKEVLWELKSLLRNTPLE